MEQIKKVGHVGVEPVVLANARTPQGALPLWRSPPQTLAGSCYPNYAGKFFPRAPFWFDEAV